MALAGTLRILASLGVALPVIAGCAGVGYREHSALTHTRYATIGHELAHYLTDHYLKSAPRRHWERIAQGVEDALPLSAPMVLRPSVLDVSARASAVPVLAAAN